MRFDKLFKFLIFLIWIILFTILVYDLFFRPLFSIVLVFVLLFLIFIYFKIKIPLYVQFLFNLMTLSGILGSDVFYLYYTSIYYDKILHFINPIILCITFFYLVRNKLDNKMLLILFCIFAAVFFASLWEVYEYGVDVLINGTAQGVYLGIEEKIQIVGKHQDTMEDLIITFVSVLLFVLGYCLFNRKEISKKS